MDTDTGGTESPNDLEQCLATYDNGAMTTPHDIYCMRKEGHTGPHRDSLRHITWRVVTSAARTREMQSEQVD
jgi:hypothetical protein